MSSNLHLASGSGGQRSVTAPTLFGSLSEKTRAELAQDAPSRRFVDGQIIQQRGDEPTGFWLIEEGAVRLGQFDAEGGFAAIALLGAGDSYGELAVLSGQPRIVDGIAVGETELRWIEGARFERAIRDDPASMRAMLGAISEELQEMIGRLAAQRSRSVEERVGVFLLNLAGKDGGAVQIGQQQLADLVGVSRATINAVLRRFEREGMIARGYGRIDICDNHALAELAGEGWLTA